MATTTLVFDATVPAFVQKQYQSQFHVTNGTETVMCPTCRIETPKERSKDFTWLKCNCNLNFVEITANLQVIADGLSKTHSEAVAAHAATPTPAPPAASPPKDWTSFPALKQVFDVLTNAQKANATLFTKEIEEGCNCFDSAMQAYSKIYDEFKSMGAQEKPMKGKMNSYIKDQAGHHDEVIKRFAYVLQNEGIVP